MYVYQLHPVRPYPYISDILSGKLNSVQYHSPVIYGAQKDNAYLYHSKSKFLSRNHKLELTRLENLDLLKVFGDLPIKKLGKKVDLVYGAIQSNLIKNHKSFTLMQHPVDHIYEMYMYLRSLKKHQYLKTRTYSNFAFQDSLEGFVDDVIKNEGLIFDKFNNQLIPEATKISKMNKHEFTGSIEYIDNWLQKVQDYLKVKIPKSGKLKYKPVKENYRKRDLELLFKEDIKIYELGIR